MDMSISFDGIMINGTILVDQSEQGTYTEIEFETPHFMEGLESEIEEAFLLVYRMGLFN